MLERGSFTFPIPRNPLAPILDPFLVSGSIAPELTKST